MYLLKPILTATLFSLFIYMEEFNISSEIIDTVAGLGAIYLILTLPKRELAIAGFFIGLFWFFWVGFSMRYYGFPYLIPLVILIFSLFYAFLFYIIGFWKNIWIRGILLISANFIEPFNFNWFKPQIIFINSHFETSIISFGLIVFGVALTIFMVKKKRRFFLFPIPFLLFFSSLAEPVDEVVNPKLKIKVVETNILQEEKWKIENQNQIVQLNINEIEKAIQDNYDMVVIPESTFPLFLNKREDILSQLLQLSNKIIIWTGGLFSENGQYYNSTYLFRNGKFEVAKKVILVPFGEYIPLPKFISHWINKIFFDGVQDFTPASQPTDFTIGEEVYRNAICYEATSQQMYQNSPKFMVAISNNGWFLPSIEPTLQKLLIQHYSNIYGVTVFHSANRKGSGVIYPKCKN